MAKIRELNPEFDEWVATRPDSVRELIEKLPPDRLYRFNYDGGHRCTIHAYCEDGTVTVTVSGDYNFLMFDRDVFGVKPEDLVEADLPSQDEPTGTMFADNWEAGEE